MKSFIFIIVTTWLSCKPLPNSQAGVVISSQESNVDTTQKIIVGAEAISQFIPQLNGKKIACVTNQTSLVNGTHLLDYLIERKIIVSKIFALEHGIRGKEDAGDKISNGVDGKTGLPIISLYGDHKKPTVDDLKDIDIIFFDIQDVGLRFYTFISSLHYVMEAAAQNGKEVWVLDRPNPNAHYTDGPIRIKELESFVGMHPVPTVYGMTMGEYAKMIQGEKWIVDADKLKLKVIPCKNYTHQTKYELPVKPSPNLPNFRSILLYPSLCLFEGTIVSVGRGTNKQFQIYGMPNAEKIFKYSFTPSPNEGAKTPPNNGVLCYGEDLTSIPINDLFAMKKITWQYYINAYQAAQESGQEYFLKGNFFDKLAGNFEIRKMIMAGKTEKEIRASYQNELKEFNKIRDKYLIYP
jgi:uncharacterized protein YbbC (DUF1343 family)